MPRKIWTADELTQLTPEQRRAVFEASVVTDLDQLDPEFRARIEERTRQLIAERDAPSTL